MLKKTLDDSLVILLYPGPKSRTTAVCRIDDIEALCLLRRAESLANDAGIDL